MSEQPAARAASSHGRRHSGGDRVVGGRAGRGPSDAGDHAPPPPPPPQPQPQQHQLPQQQPARNVASAGSNPATAAGADQRCSNTPTPTPSQRASDSPQWRWEEDNASVGGDSGADETRSGDEYQMEDDEYDPSEQEIAEYCDWLGMDRQSEKSLTWIAREALKAPLPEYWKICYTDEREVYYFNMRTGESIWDHPMDAYYKSLFRQEKSKLDKKRKKMRLYANSLTIRPLQELFSEICEGNAEVDDGHTTVAAMVVPESLCDPIDFMLFVDPVVLPTSGRTVSKHTFVNNKWRDPFSREYVENRRLINNVDKRHEVSVWLAKAVNAYFEDVLFSPEIMKWGSTVASPVNFGQKDTTCSFAPEPDTLYDIPHKLSLLLKILPFLLDKEDEVSLEGQRLTLQWVQAAYALPPVQGKVKRKPSTPPVSPSPARKAGGRGVADVKASRADLPENYSEVIHAVNALEDPAQLLAPLLTMSTSASLEALCVIMHHHPHLRDHPCFESFSPDVLNVLQLSEIDLISMAKTISASPSFPPRTSNADFKSSSAKLNILARLPWEHALFSLCAAYHSLPNMHDQPSLVIQALRGLSQWPTPLYDAEIVRWMVTLAISASGHSQQILLLYDLLVSCGETATQVCKKFKSTILPILFLPWSSDVDATHAAALGAVLVHNDVCRLDEFSDSLHMQMRIAREIVPRLTRMQWKPKHFEATVQVIVSCLTANPLLGWEVFQADRVDFLLKELSKKKKGRDELRLKLEGIEAAEKRLQQSYAINNWLIVSLKLKGISDPVVDKAVARKQEMLKERLANLVLLFSLLLTVRLKLKTVRRDAERDGAKDAIVGEPAREIAGLNKKSAQPPQKLPSAATTQSVPPRRPNVTLRLEKESVLTADASLLQPTV
eukprot:gene14250-21856_t